MPPTELTDNLRWLDTVIQGQYLPGLSFEHKLRRHKQRFGKLPPQLYQIKMKICYDQGCNDIGVEMMLLPTLLAAVFLGTGNCSSKIVYWSFYLR